MSARGPVRRSHLPLALALLVFGVVTAASVESALARCDGHLVYAIDDTYIHLAMAKTIVNSGTWGIWPGQAAFASSSPGWTLFLAVLRAFGASSLWMPLVLNVIAGIALLAGLDAAARRLLETDRARSWLLVAAVFVMPMPALVLLGMETLAHAAAVVWLIGLAARANDRTEGGVHSTTGTMTPPPHRTEGGVHSMTGTMTPPPRRTEGGVHSTTGTMTPPPHRDAVTPDVEAGSFSPSSNAPRLITIGVLSAIAAALRYESLFVVTAVVALLLARRRRTLAAAAIVGAAVPVVAYGLFSWAHGGPWLPDSLLLKAQPPDLLSLQGLMLFLADKGLPALFAQPPFPSILIVLLALLVLDTWRRPRLEGESNGWLLIAAGAILLQIHLVNFEWMYRYRAFLVVTGVAAGAFAWSDTVRHGVLSGTNLRQPWPRYAGFLLLAAGLTFPLAVRAIDALTRGPRGSEAIYEQQYQVARFLAASGSGPVAVNDIGAVAYYSGRFVVDLFGLGTPEIAELRRSRSFSTADIARITRRAGVEVAVVYEQRFTGATSLPSSWMRVARWRSSEAASVAHDTVAFFAMDREGADRLEAALRRFSPGLPAGVTVMFDRDGR